MAEEKKDGREKVKPMSTCPVCDNDLFPTRNTETHEINGGFCECGYRTNGERMTKRVKPKKGLKEELIEMALFYYGVWVTFLVAGQLPNEPTWIAVSSLISIGLIILVVVYLTTTIYNAYREAHPKEASE